MKMLCKGGTHTVREVINDATGKPVAIIETKLWLTISRHEYGVRILGEKVLMLANGGDFGSTMH